ncbi:MAG: hypothetical protein ACYDGR_15340, partial [Candidatus Dormibacteria bacterium]
VSMLDQMASAGVEVIDEASVRRQLGLVSGFEVAQLLSATAAGRTGDALRLLDSVAEQGADLRQLANALAEMARRAVLLELGAATAGGLGLADEVAAALGRLSATPGFAARAFELGLSAVAQMRQAHDPRLVLELLLIRLGSGGAAPGLAAPPADSASSPHRDEIVVRDAPQSSPAEEVEVTVSSPGAAAGLDELVAAWPSLLDALRGSAPAMRVRALLNDAALLELEEDQVTVGFRYALHSEKAQEAPNREALEAAMKQAFGRPFRLRFKVDPALQPARARRPESAGQPALAASVPSPPSTRELAPSGTPPGDSGPDLDPEGLVRSAVDILGATITGVRPKARGDR